VAAGWLIDDAQNLRATMEGMLRLNGIMAGLLA
jgi:hypothetical protein